jgi:acetate kinase
MLGPKLALAMFCHRVAFFIGGYIALLGGLDALVFSAGIGENAWHVRRHICKYLEPIGIEMDYDVNRRNNSIIVSKPSSKVKIYIIPANEELQIAKEAQELIKYAKPAVREEKESNTNKRLKELNKKY